MADAHQTFEQACIAAHEAIRLALIKACASVGVDPTIPQDAARVFGLNKNLTWKIWKIVSTRQSFEALRYLPSKGGITILVNGLKSADCDPVAVAELRHAVDNFESVIHRHIGDRATFELVVDGMIRKADSRLELSRKLAFRGASGIWGVQARTKLTIKIVAPSNDHSDRLDVGLIAGFLGFRRLRPDAQWPLIRNCAAGAPSNPQWKTFSDLCSKNMPALQLVQVGDRLDYIIPPGPMGNLAAFDCLFEKHLATSPSGQTDHGRAFCELSAPVESQTFDLILHQSLAASIASPPKLLVIGDCLSNSAADVDDAPALPIHGRITKLKAADAKSDNHPLNSRLHDYLLQRMGLKPDDCVRYRAELSYPPVGCTVIIR